MTKYKQITEMENRIIEIDREIIRLIEEKNSLKIRIEEISSFGKTKR